MTAQQAELTLPTEPSKIKTKLEEYNILIYGLPKVGKSSFAAQFDHPLFLATEAGLNALETYERVVSDWPTFLGYAKLIAEGKHPFKTIVIDPIQNLYLMCEEYVCKRAGISHPSDQDHGKGWSLVKTEFTRAIIKLSLLPYGLVMIAHSDTVEIKTRTGNITKAIPRLSGVARDIVESMADLILYFSSELTKDGEKRMIKARPSENWTAGTKFKSYMFPTEIPMGSEPEEAYANFRQAFDAAIVALQAENEKKKQGQPTLV